MRCNVGINPQYLVDQHLLAEMMEIPMVVGSLRYWNFEIKSKVPEKFDLGSGHMNFLKTKLVYLSRRHSAVSKEIERRGFKNTKSRIILDDVPNKYCNNWSPTFEDSYVIRQRIIFKLLSKSNIKFWRYNRQYLDTDKLKHIIFKTECGELFCV